jgi:hypothetical protein
VILHSLLFNPRISLSCLKFFLIFKISSACFKLLTGDLLRLFIMVIFLTMGFYMHRQILLCTFILYIVKLAQASSLLLLGGTIIAFNETTSSLQVLRDSSMLIINDRIHTVFTGAPNTTLPSDTQVINVTNQIISPGFVDTHRHGWQTAFRTIASNTSVGMASSEYVNGGGSCDLVRACISSTPS